MHKPAPMSHNEADRLIAVNMVNELEHVKDQDFEAIIELAKGSFNVPIVLVSLVDIDRQWFKAKCGVDIHETSRDIAFCSYTILSTEVMVVLDAKLDNRFKTNPLVTGEPNIRFYAGAPIIVPDGLVLGTLCIIDTLPRENFSEQEKKLLAQLGDAASALIQKKAGL